MRQPSGQEFRRHRAVDHVECDAGERQCTRWIAFYGHSRCREKAIWLHGHECCEWLDNKWPVVVRRVAG